MTMRRGLAISIIALSVLKTYPVCQNTDSLDLGLHKIPWLDPAVDLDTASTTYRPAAQYIAWEDPFFVREIGDDLREREPHLSDAALRPDLPIDTQDHVRAGCIELVRGCDTRTDGIGKVFSLER